jgi:hypothetical protein
MPDVRDQPNWSTFAARLAQSRPLIASGGMGLPAGAASGPGSDGRKSSVAKMSLEMKFVRVAGGRHGPFNVLKRC